jgi:hypothetical protein
MKFCAERKYTYMSVYAPTSIVRRWFDGYRAAAADLGYVPDPPTGRRSSGRLPPSPTGWPSYMRSLAGSDS